MKCDELKEIMLVNQVSGERTPSGTYKKVEVDKAIAELKDKVSQYKTLYNEKCRDIDTQERLFAEQIYQLKAENEGLKNELFAVKSDLAMATRWRKVSEELPEVK